MKKITINKIKNKIRIYLGRIKFTYLKLIEGDNFKTSWKRPKYVENIKYLSKSFSRKDIAITLQGQLLLDNHFTLETVKLYRKSYRDCPIIVSTWDNEDSEEIRNISKIDNVKVITSSYPQNSGLTHINYQKKSSLEGIKYANELGCNYVLKSRTDQRIYGNNIIEYFLKLIERFPLNIKCKANKRIIVSNLVTIKNRLYNLSDMLLFGQIDDMLLYFSPPDCKDPPKEYKLPKEKDDLVGFCKARAGEIYFATHYIESLGFELKWTFEDSDYYRNNLFIVIDSESIDQFWPKYTRKEYMWRNYYGNEFELASFEDWFVHQVEEDK